jgi:hypothetical protein
MNHQDVYSILNLFGEHVPPDSRLTLLGGSALILLGNSRETVDIDFVGDDINPSELHRRIIQIAKDNKILLDIVPIEHFVPLPQGSEERVIPVGQFGNLNVFVADPYSIALSKIDRGLANDYADIEFLLAQGHIALDMLTKIVESTLAKAGKYDLDPDFLKHFEELKSRLK